MKYDSVIFDLDGTLLDTLGDLWGSTNFALSQLGLPTRTLDEVRRFVGNGVANLIKRAVGDNGDEEIADKALEIFREHYALHNCDTTCPYEGVIELLISLRERGVKVAIVSNKIDWAVQELSEKYFKGLVDCAVGELSGIARKPEPDMVYLAMEKLGCKAPVYVGDSEVDVRTAKNANMDGIFVTYGFRTEDDLRLAGGECIVDTVAELSAILTAEA